MSYREVSEIRDGMRIEWDMPIEMDDGLVLRCDIFRPVKKGRYPVLLSHGPYGKWLHFEDGYKTAWKRMEEKQPDVMAGSSNKYQSWEVCDPRNGCRTAMSSCASTPAAVAARPAISSTGLRARPRISPTASNGAACSHGRMARSASPAFPITPSTSGRWRACSRSISPPFASGKASPTSIASSATMAASTTPSPRTGTTCR